MEAFYDKDSCHTNSYCYNVRMFKTPRKISLLPLILMLWAWVGLCYADVHLNIVGRVETGKLMDQNVTLSVKMDTGAQTSSLSAHDIKIFEKEGREWVSFVIDNTHVAMDHRFEYPLKRMVRIKKRQSEINSKEPYERRPVVEMAFCLGNEQHLIEINLNDRSNFIYPMLLGRSAMEQFAILIDPSASFTAKPTCENAQAENASEVDASDTPSSEKE